MDATQIEQKAKALVEQAASLTGEMAQFATDVGGLVSPIAEASTPVPTVSYRFSQFSSWPALSVIMWSGKLHQHCIRH